MSRKAVQQPLQPTIGASAGCCTCSSIADGLFAEALIRDRLVVPGNAVARARNMAERATR
jgi:hypothetical protein